MKKTVDVFVQDRLVASYPVVLEASDPREEEFIDRIRRYMRRHYSKEDIAFNRVGDAGRIRFDRAQVTEELPSLRLAAGRLIELAHNAKRCLLERANLWRASSALWCCALWHRGYLGKDATRFRASTPQYDRPRAMP